ncbi:MAG: TetR/AcrR family transcriptional regulator [Puniceicoccaceae bacterium]
MAGRPRAYNRTQIIRIATQLFWDQGYAGTSLIDLTRAMRVSKSTFYAAFGSKDALYQICLEEYGKVFFRDMVQMVTAESHVLDSIRKYFVRIAREELDHPPAKGCMLVKSANEIGTHHPILSPVINRLLGITRSTLQNALELAKRKNELPENFNTPAAATYLVSQMCGLRTLVRANFSEAELENLVDRILIHLRTDL